MLLALLAKLMPVINVAKWQSTPGVLIYFTQGQSTSHNENVQQYPDLPVYHLEKL